MEPTPQTAEPATPVSSPRGRARPTAGGTPVGIVGASSPSWTPSSQRIRCPQKRGNSSRFGATAVLLSAGRNIALRFPAGDRYATHSTSQEELVAMIEEVLPAALHAAVRSEQSVSFPYEYESACFMVHVEPTGRAWKALIEAKGAVHGAPANPIMPPERGQSGVNPGASPSRVFGDGASTL